MARGSWAAAALSVGALVLAGAAPATAAHGPISIDVRIDLDDRTAPGPQSPMIYAVEGVEIADGPELTSDDLVSNASSLPCAGVTVDVDRTGEVVVAWDGREPSCPIRVIEVTIIGHSFAGPYVAWDRLLGVPTPGEEPILDPGGPEPEEPVVSDLSVFVGDFATVLTWTARESEEAFLVDQAWFRFELAEGSEHDDDTDGGTDEGTDGGGDTGGGSEADGGGTDEDGASEEDGGAEEGDGAEEGGAAPPPAAPAVPTTATPTYTG